MYQQALRTISSFRRASSQQVSVPGWTPLPPSGLQPGGVALSTKSGSLPESFIRMRESDIVLGSSQSPQLDMMIDCWKTPRWWLQNPLPPAPQPPPNFEVRFTGSFPKGLKAVDVLHLMQQLIATDPNNFSSSINYDQTLLLVALANYLITIRGTLVGWTTQS